MSKSKPSTQNDTNEQYHRFIETARQLEADEDKQRFEEKLGRIARAKPAKKPVPKPKSDRK